MKYLDAAAWLAVVLCLASYLSAGQSRVPVAECQVYDRFGRGIGCEEEDLTDRLIRIEQGQR